MGVFSVCVEAVGVCLLPWNCGLYIDIIKLNVGATNVLVTAEIDHLVCGRCSDD